MLHEQHHGTRPPRSARRDPRSRLTEVRGYHARLARLKGSDKLKVA